MVGAGGIAVGMISIIGHGQLFTMAGFLHHLGETGQAAGPQFVGIIQIIHDVLAARRVQQGLPLLDVVQLRLFVDHAGQPIIGRKRGAVQGNP